MIRTRDLVPGVYYNESRDFQLLGRVFEIVFNHCKTNIDLMEGLPFSRNCDTNMLPLLATSLGFASRRNYSREELAALCSSFAGLLRSKGTKKAIQEATNLMLHAHNINKVADVELTGDCEFTIYIPQELDDITILEDIFDYILPCGFTYNFVNTQLTHPYKGASIGVSDRIAYRKYDKTPGGTIGLVSTPGNMESPSMPAGDGWEIPQGSTSLVSAGTVVAQGDKE